MPLDEIFIFSKNDIQQGHIYQDLGHSTHNVGCPDGKSAGYKK